MLDVNSYELINKCSTFLLFDLIRSVGGREATATAEKRPQRKDYDRLQRLQTQQGLQQPQLQNATSSNNTTESVKEWDDNDTKV